MGYLTDYRFRLGKVRGQRHPRHVQPAPTATGIWPSPPSEADSGIGLYRTEVINLKGPWRGLEDVEIATLEWVWWFNHRRLLEPIGYLPPAEFEEAFYRDQKNNRPDAVLN